MSHPRSPCPHAHPGRTPALLTCALRIVPDDSHVGACAVCPRNPAYVPRAKAAPMDWRKAGPKLWAELHARPAAYQGDSAAEQQWLEEFAGRIGCGECARHWRELVATMPPDLSTPAAYWRWGVDAHNAVNVRVGKPVWRGHQ